MMRGIDITNMRFGRLVATSFYGHAKDGALLWLCKCDCGNEKIIRSKSLRLGLTRSCGCLSLEAFLKNKNGGVKKGTLRGPYRTPHHTGIYAYLNNP